MTDKEMKQLQPLWDMQALLWMPPKECTGSVESHPDGTFTDENGINVFEDGDRFIYAYHTATTPEDFQIVLNRHFEKDRTEDIGFFKNKVLLERAQSIAKGLDTPLFHKHNGRELEKIENFIKWLKGGDVCPSNEKTVKREIINYESLDEVFKNDDAKEKAYKLLIEKGIIDENHIISTDATQLYAHIKQMRNYKYFKDIQLKDLHPLVNKAFNCNSTSHNWRKVKEGNYRYLTPF